MLKGDEQCSLRSERYAVHSWEKPGMGLRGSPGLVEKQRDALNEVRYRLPAQPKVDANSTAKENVNHVNSKARSGNTWFTSSISKASPALECYKLADKTTAKSRKKVETTHDPVWNPSDFSRPQSRAAPQGTPAAQLKPKDSFQFGSTMWEAEPTTAQHAFSPNARFKHKQPSKTSQAYKHDVQIGRPCDGDLDGVHQRSVTQADFCAKQLDTRPMTCPASMVGPYSTQKSKVFPFGTQFASTPQMQISMGMDENEVVFVPVATDRLGKAYGKKKSLIPSQIQVVKNEIQGWEDACVNNGWHNHVPFETEVGTQFQHAVLPSTDCTTQASKENPLPIGKDAGFDGNTTSSVVHCSQSFSGPFVGRNTHTHKKTMSKIPLNTFNEVAPKVYGHKHFSSTFKEQVRDNIKGAAGKSTYQGLHSYDATQARANKREHIKNLKSRFLQSNFTLGGDNFDFAHKRPSLVTGNGTSCVDTGKPFSATKNLMRIFLAGGKNLDSAITDLNNLDCDCYAPVRSDMICLDQRRVVELLELQHRVGEEYMSQYSSLRCRLIARLIGFRALPRLIAINQLPLSL
ncbi:hypothetical protein CYMTET_40481 [Cymbomonas tetramitiformis]|uniref:Uncharacterized protein n=1 Tax=Cymbomonas tetramitiformis TaxID=36881 RepID=A0AAE0F2Y0_9CHLO|nr:hypothetical protein CYMTET_40481 [Cymbomonas tetramitiformis]